MKKINNAPICFDEKHPYVIICEGADEYYFLIHYLEYLEKNDDGFKDCYKVIDFGGVDDFSQGLKNIKSYPKYESMKGFLIVRDAEQNVNKAIDSLKNDIKNVWGIEIENDGNLQYVKEGLSIGFYLFPGLNDDGGYMKGTLEDLCSEIVSYSSNGITADELLNDVSEYMSRLEKKRKKEMQRRHKNKLHMYFSSTDNFVGEKIGEATKSGAFDLSSNKLVHLKNLIINMPRLHEEKLDDVCKLKLKR